MASLDAALNRLAIAIDALEARLPAALSGKPAKDAADEIVRLKADRDEMQEEMERLRAEVKALDELHDDMSNRLEAAMREVQQVVDA